jgi:hypothetical protein
LGLDIRIPLGLIFLLIGGLMSLYGLITRHSAAAKNGRTTQSTPPLGKTHAPRH